MTVWRVAKVIEIKAYLPSLKSVFRNKDRSPFRTASLPKAQKANDQDPIIIFKERSSDLEVGQLSIIDSDIFNVLKRRNNKKAAIYGFAETGADGKNVNQLSLSRALLISEYLVDKGIDPERIEARAMALTRLSVLKSGGYCFNRLEMCITNLFGLNKN